VGGRFQLGLSAIAFRTVTEEPEVDGRQRVDNEEVLEGGNVTPVVRVGDTVRRSTGPWTPSVHALLTHLRRKGVDIVPEVRGLDAQGREVLSYIPGQVGTFPSGWPFTDDECLVGIGRTLRRLHHATVDFTAPDDRWRFQIGAPREGEVICHNDFAPYNCIFDEGEIVGVFDWDFAAPGPPEWDLVHALWRFTPLYPPAAWWLGDQEPFSVVRLVHRMRRLCDGYGVALTAGLVDLLEQREAVVFHTAKVWSAAGVPGFENMLSGVETEDQFAELAYLRSLKHALLGQITAPLP
jgi:hypothetical protein